MNTPIRRTLVFVMILAMLTVAGSPVMASPGGHEAAPAIASRLLREAGIANRYNGMNLVSLVARETGRHGTLSKWAHPGQASLERAVRDFLKELGVPLSGAAPAPPEIPDRNETSVTYLDQEDGTGLLTITLRDGNGDPVSGLRAGDFQVVTQHVYRTDTDDSRITTFDFTDNWFSFDRKADGVYEVVFAPGTSPVRDEWDLYADGVRIKQDLLVTTSQVWQWDGSFQSAEGRSFAGTQWFFDVQVRRFRGADQQLDQNGTIVLATDEDPGDDDERIDASVSRFQWDYGYWYDGDADDPLENLAAAGTASWDEGEYYFMFLLSSEKIWFALSETDYGFYWDDETVWGSGLRILDLHSSDGFSPFDF